MLLVGQDAELATLTMLHGTWHPRHPHSHIIALLRATSLASVLPPILTSLVALDCLYPPTIASFTAPCQFPLLLGSSRVWSARYRLSRRRMGRIIELTSVLAGTEVVNGGLEDISCQDYRLFRRSAVIPCPFPKAKRNPQYVFVRFWWHFSYILYRQKAV